MACWSGSAPTSGILSADTHRKPTLPLTIEPERGIRIHVIRCAYATDAAVRARQITFAAGHEGQGRQLLGRQIRDLTPHAIERQVGALRNMARTDAIGDDYMGRLRNHGTVPVACLPLVAYALQSRHVLREISRQLGAACSEHGSA
jgi:hypothetical protein